MYFSDFCFVFFFYDCACQVETFGSMDIREKTEFIVEQMRMCLAIKDFTRAQILSRKISPKTFAKEDNHVRTNIRKRRILMVMRTNRT